ncbi:MAG: adenosine deaminase [Actinomycetota bacterium]|nr:adenosine deaminase [Actinomycetota bacterium]
MIGERENSDAIDRLIRAMPKVEIHVHLEGATGPDTIWDMAQRNNVDLPAGSRQEWREFYEFRDFAHFIEVYISATSAMRTPQDFEQMVRDFAGRQAAQNIRYSEAYVSPQFHLDAGLSQEELLDALAAGSDSGWSEHKSRVRFIADISRQTEMRRDDVLPFALAGHERGGLVIGIGIGGIEEGHPPEQFETIFAEARRGGLHTVAHAGESAGPASVWGALRSLHAERIGHGIRSLEDPELIAYLRDTRIPLEVSPNSNYRTKLVPAGEPHPIRALVDAGVYVTVNSDDPPMFSTDLNNEYLTLARQGFSFEELWQLNLATLEASFLPENEKAVLRQEWMAFADKTEASSSGL